MAQTPGDRSHGTATATRPPISPDLAILVLVLIWGANFSVVKYALEQFRPLAFNALRFVLASAVLLAVLRPSRMTFRLEPGDLRKFVGLGLLGNVVYQLMFIFGVHWTLAGNAALMLATVPIFVSLFSTLLGHERIAPAGWLGVALSVGGIALVVWGGTRAVQFGQETVRGDLTMLGAAVAWSAYTVGAAPLVKRYGPLRTTAGTMWIGTVVLVAISLPSLLAQDWAIVSSGAWAGLVFSGALSIALAYLIWYYGVRHLGSSRTAIYSNTVPLVAIVVAWLTLGETPTLLQLVGAASIVGGVLLAKLGVERDAVGAAVPLE
ncbi:MAG: DMT family transporter [marine benthic group bacterium]|nr:DMT family transporter [Candidatus Benthicola marisminoris]